MATASQKMMLQAAQHVLSWFLGAGHSKGLSPVKCSSWCRPPISNLGAECDRMPCLVCANIRGCQKWLPRQHALLKWLHHCAVRCCCKPTSGCKLLGLAHGSMIVPCAFRLMVQAGSMLIQPDQVF